MTNQGTDTVYIKKFPMLELFCALPRIVFTWLLLFFVNRFVLHRACAGDTKGAIIFVYFCPESTPIRMKMIMSSAKVSEQFVMRSSYHIRKDMITMCYLLQIFNLLLLMRPGNNLG